MPPRYKSWPGNNLFLFGGRVMLGSSYRHLAITFVLTTVPIVTFIAATPLLLFTAAATMVLYGLTIVLLFTTGSVEPGIIPRNPPEVEVDPPSDDEQQHAALQFKYCDTCNIYRPPRSKHCRACNNCVEVFDHHCPWTGNCVGRRNYKFYLSFVLLVNLLSLFVLVACLAVLGTATEAAGAGAASVSPASGFGTGVRLYPLTLVVAIYALVTLILVGGLLSFHVSLLCKGQTTNELLKGVYKKGRNTFDRGFWTNLRGVCCDPQEPSRLPDFTAEEVIGAGGGGGGGGVRGGVGGGMMA